MDDLESPAHQAHLAHLDLLFHPLASCVTEAPPAFQEPQESKGLWEREARKGLLVCLAPKVIKAFLVYLVPLAHQAALRSRGKGVSLGTPVCLGFLEIEGQWGLLDLVHRGLLVKRAFKVFLGGQVTLVCQDQKVNLVRPLQKQGCQVSLVPQAEMENLDFQVIPDIQANRDSQGAQVQRVIQVYPALVFQAHQGLKVSLDCQVSLGHQEPPEDPVKMGHLDHLEFKD
ncbi:UNVERIFIED_CONTAM: hypothetical protein K2H54_047321 [Gekko kuhli]